jgi:hypothetical protein
MISIASYDSFIHTVFTFLTETTKKKESKLMKQQFSLDFIFFFFLGFELRASHLLGRCFYHLSHSASPTIFKELDIKQQRRVIPET